MKRLITVLIVGLGVAAGLVMLTGCGPQNVNVTPQAAVAHYATDVVSGLTAYQALIVKATEGTPPLLTVAQATPRMNEIRKGLNGGQQLATLLRQYDALAPGSAERQPLIAQIQAALTALSTLGLEPATLPAAIVGEGTRLVSNVQSIIANARAAVAAGGM